VVAVAACGFAAFRYFAPSPRGQAVPVTVTNAVVERDGSSSLHVVSIPGSIQQLIHDDCGSYCGTDQIRIHLRPVRDFKRVFRPMLVGEIGNPYWKLYTTAAVPEPADRTFRFSVVVVVNRRPTYEIRVAVPTAILDSAVDSANASIGWLGPLLFFH
jgi:hypothetical protein